MAVVPWGRGCLVENLLWGSGAGSCPVGGGGGRQKEGQGDQGGLLVSCGVIAPYRAVPEASLLLPSVPQLSPDQG